VTEEMTRQITAALQPLEAYGFEAPSITEPGPGRIKVVARNPHIEIWFQNDYAEASVNAGFRRYGDPSLAEYGLVSNMAPLGAAVSSSEDVRIVQTGPVTPPQFPNFIAVWVGALVDLAGDLLSGDLGRAKALQILHYRKVISDAASRGAFVHVPDDIRKALDDNS